MNAPPSTRRKQLTLWLGSLCVFLLACNLLAPGSSESTPIPTNTPEPIEPTMPAAPTATVDMGVNDDSQEEEAGKQKSSNTSCPQDALGFLMINHDFQVNTGFGPWQWEAAGRQDLYFDETGQVSVDASQSVPGMISGELASEKNRCIFEAAAEVFVSVEGSCKGGVVTLTIWENWVTGEYEWTCDDEAFTFELPPSEPARHPNVIFRLEDDLTPVTASFPWGGGTGAKTWTLYPPPPKIP